MPRAAKKKAEPIHVVRRWESSPVIYGPLRCKGNEDVSPNPNYHPPVCLTSKGTLVDERGVQLDPKNVPDYIKAEARGTNLDIEYHPPKKREVTMEDAMLSAGVQDTDPRHAARRGQRAMYA